MMVELLIALLVAQVPSEPANTPPADALAPPPIELSLRVFPKPATSPDAQAADPQGLNPTTPPGAPAAAEDGRPLEVRLAEPLILELTATSRRDTEVFLPLLPAVGTFEIVAPEKGIEKVEGDVKTTTRRWTILPVRMGIEKLPPIEVPYRTASNAEGSVSTLPLRIYIRGHLENDNDPALGKSPPLVDIVTTNWVLIWILSVLGALVVAALIGWVLVLALRQRFDALKPKAPPRPAIEVAMERLARIEAQSDAELDGGRRVAETVDTLREYLGRRYNIDALEMTTNELMRQLPTLDLRGIEVAQVRQLLEDADLVKFARLMPPEDEARRPATTVRSIVQATWIVEEKAEEIDVRAEPASSRQRLFAGLIDALIAGALGLFAMLGLFLGGVIELGWLALVLVGLVLAVRDAFGQSPGKQVMRIIAVRRDKEQTRPELKRLMTRNLLLFVWPLTLPIEWLVLRQHPLGLRLGDMLADTEVVRDRPGRAGRTEQATAATAPIQTPPKGVPPAPQTSGEAHS